MPDQIDPRRVVANGYDRIAERYARWVTDDVIDEVRAHYVTMVLDRLPRGAAVLDLGCGGGGPSTQQLAQQFALTVVDISVRQIDRARQNIPQATFIHGDITHLDFPRSAFDGVIALYSLT